MPDCPMNPDHLAASYIDLCVRKWIEKRLPVAPLAAAMTAWGLNASTHLETAEAVADGLERLAEAVRDLEVADALTTH